MRSMTKHGDQVAKLREHFQREAQNAAHAARSGLANDLDDLDGGLSASATSFPQSPAFRDLVARISDDNDDSTQDG